MSNSKRFYITLDLRGDLEKQMIEQFFPEVLPRLKALHGATSGDITLRFRVQRDMVDCYGDVLRIYPVEEKTTALAQTLTPVKSPFSCGHSGFLSIYPRPDGGTQCTACANKARGLEPE